MQRLQRFKGQVVVTVTATSEVTEARKAGKCEAPAPVMNTQCKGSVGAKACEFVVQPTPNMCGLGGSVERPAVQRRTIRSEKNLQSRKEHSGVSLQEYAWSAKLL